MSVFSPTSSDTDVAPRLIRQVCESMMSPLVTGWLIGCPNFDRNWWFNFFSSHQFTLHLLVNCWDIRSFSRWLLIHNCQQHRNNNLTLQNEKTTTMCGFNSGPSNRRRICLPAWMNVSMPLSINRVTLRIGRFTSTTVKPTRSSSPLTPEVCSPRTVGFRPTDMLGCSRIHQKLDKLTFSHSCIIGSHHKFHRASQTAREPPSA